MTCLVKLKESLQNCFSVLQSIFIKAFYTYITNLPIVIIIFSALNFMKMKNRVNTT